MRWLTASNLISLFGALATLIVGWVALNASYDLFEQGDAPPKRMQGMAYVTDPLNDLSKPGSSISISVASGGKELKNLRVAQATLRNNGRAPILPGDIIEPIALETKAPWQIIEVVNSFDGNIGVKLKWQKQSVNKFEATPTLLNPGDIVFVTAYLAAPEIPASSSKAPLEWSARVVNLNFIEEAPIDNYANQLSGTLPIQVFLWGWGVPFTVFSFSVYFGLTLLLMNANRMIRPRKLGFYAAALVASIINLSAAEAGATYVFGTLFFEKSAARDWYNVPPLVLNAIMLLWLAIASFRSSRREIDAPPGQA